MRALLRRFAIAQSRSPQFLPQSLLGLTSPTLLQPKARSRSPLQMASKKFVMIDGSTLEGGGQVLRNSTSLSALLKKPIHITKVRAKRSRPGLQPQHLTGISLVSEMYQGSLTGAEVKSAEVTFSPGGFRAGKYVADTKTAGSLCLLIQVSLPCLVFGSLDGQETHVKLCGGTNASNAPQIDYFQRVFGPIVTRFGIGYELELVKRGFYPQGRGLAHLRCRSLKAGQTLTPLVMESQGQLKEILITAFTAGIVPHHEAQDASRTAQEILADHYPGVPIRIELTQETRDSAYGNGAAITVTATTSTDCILAGSALGEKGKDGFAMGTEAANQLIQNIDQGGALDEFAQDQVIIFMALANGHSKVRVGPIQLHTETSIHFATYMTGASFTVTPVDPQDFERPDTEQSFWIECDGIAYNSTPAASSSKRK